MAAVRVTVMLLKVDLQCPCCYKKVKKILCKTPQIRDQVFDEKANTVTITVVCCNPEKIRDKLCCKGAKVIQSIKIQPEKPKEPEKPKPKEPEKPKDPEKPKEPQKPKKPEKPKEPQKPEEPQKPKEPEKPKQPDKPQEPEKPKEPDKKKPPPPEPDRRCRRKCYEGYSGGPCYNGCGVLPPPAPCYDGYYGYGCGQGRGWHVSRCDYYFSEENPQSCSIM